jgi:quercetin dioxygenase-like cupin family protein
MQRIKFRPVRHFQRSALSIMLASWPRQSGRGIDKGAEVMQAKIMKRASLRGLGVATLVAAGVLALGAGAAQAGGCPVGKMVQGGAGQPQSSAGAKGVTDTVIASSNLAQEPVGIHDRQFRLRRLGVQPGGVVPWHSHADRPALIYVVEGEITEYASTCAVPIVHRAGEATPETHATAHW